MKKKMVRKWVFAILIILLALNANAHGQKEETTEQISYLNDPIFVLIGITTVILASIAIYEGLEKREKKKARLEEYKKIIFFLIVVVVIGVSGYILVDSVKTNIISWSDGPIHWHADFEIWHCGRQIDMMDPSGVTNRIGSPVFHEHGDNRIHIEGPVMKKEDATLMKFFEVIGGELDDDHMIVPTNNGDLMIENGKCPDGRESFLQIFLYKVKDENNKPWEYEQMKIGDHKNYIISPYPDVPPGDCLIIEFDEKKERTDKQCISHEVAAERGGLIGS